MTVRPQVPRRRSRPHLILATLAAVAVVGGVTGCGPGTTVQPVAQGKPAPTEPTTPASQSPAPLATESGPGILAGGGACDLLTPDAVSAAVGAPMQQMQASTEYCIYDLISDPSQQLLVHIFPDKTNMDNFTGQIESVSAHIDGLGDDAFYSAVADVIFVRKGDRAFTITSLAIAAKDPTDPNAAKAPFTSLATLALSNF